MTHGMDAMGRKDVPELEAAFNLLRQIYWREYGRGWREVIAKIRNTAADSAADGETFDGGKDGN